MIHLIFDDMKIITLARQLCKNGDHKRVIVNNCGLLKETVGGSIDINKNSSLMYSIKGRMLFLAATLLCLKKILNQRRDKKLNTFTRVKIIFEQIYKGQEGNSEFDVFYRYFKERDDVLYIEHYDEGTIWLRYPIMHSDADKIKKEAELRGMILGDWYREVIAPDGTNMETMNYQLGKNKTAEYVASKVLNLPTNIRTSQMEAQEVASLVKAYNWKQQFKK